MTQQLTDYQAAEQSVLTCAVFLAESITSYDGHAEAIEKIVPIFLAKNDVDVAAQLADSVENNFVRDRLLVEVAEKCATNDDDEYALQLAHAIEDRTFQEETRERIAIHKAQKGLTGEALELAETISDNSSILGAVALKFQEKGDEAQALQMLEIIEESAAKVYYLQEVALKFNESDQREKAVNLLETAVEEAKNIEIAEEKIRALQSIAYIFREIGRKDKCIEVLAKAQSQAELLAGGHRNSLLSQISVGFLQAGSLELADRTLDLVDDKAIIAATLTHYAEDYFNRGEAAEAIEILEEARAILQSQHEREVRNSQEKFGVLSSIATQFASLDKPERAIEVALENPIDSKRFAALEQIAQVCVSKNKGDLANQAIKEITEDAERLKALIAISDVYQKDGKPGEALNLLREIRRQIEDVGQISLRIELFNELALRFHRAGETESARQIARDNISNIGRIFDESLKAIALANLGAVYEQFKVELNQEEKDALLSLLRQPPRF